MKKPLSKRLMILALETVAGVLILGAVLFGIVLFSAVLAGLTPAVRIPEISRPWELAAYAALGLLSCAGGAGMALARASWLKL